MARVYRDEGLMTRTYRHLMHRLTENGNTNHIKMKKLTVISETVLINSCPTLTVHIKIYFYYLFILFREKKANCRPLTTYFVFLVLFHTI